MRAGADGFALRRMQQGVMPTRPPQHRPRGYDPQKQKRDYNRFARNPQVERWRSSVRWQKLREHKRTLNPICEDCAQRGITNARYLSVHHKKLARDCTEEEFFDLDMLVTVCGSCHRKRDRRLFGQE